MDIIVPTGKIRIVLDATLYTSFQACDEQFRLKHILNLVPMSGMGKAIEKGSMMHHILETFYKAKKAGKDRNDRLQAAVNTGQTYITGCEHCIANACLIHKDNSFKGPQSITIDDGHDVINTFQQYEEFWKNDSWTTLEVEHVKGKVIYEDDELSLLWKAKCDWIVDTDVDFGISVDHKTASRRDDVSSLDNQFIGQCIVNNQLKMYRNVIGYQTSLKPHEKFTREAVNYTKSRIAEWTLETASYAYDLAAVLDSQRFRHRFTSCRRRFGDCIFRHVCEGEPEDRQRLLNEKFKVSDRIWDISND